MSGDSNCTWTSFDWNELKFVEEITYCVLDPSYRAVFDQIQTCYPNWVLRL